jgi:hypothetical protein
MHVSLLITRSANVNFVPNPERGTTEGGPGLQKSG